MFHNTSVGRFKIFVGPAVFQDGLRAVIHAVDENIFVSLRRIPANVAPPAFPSRKHPRHTGRRSSARRERPTKGRENDENTGEWPGDWFLISIAKFTYFGNCLQRADLRGCDPFAPLPTGRQARRGALCGGYFLN